MPRSMNQKKKLSILREVLLERSDKAHPLTMKGLIDALSEQGIKAERKSIYDDLQSLRELGLDIVTLRGRQTGYYVATRKFENDELKLLVGAIASAESIAQNQREELTEKLLSFASIHEREEILEGCFENKNKL